MAEKNATLLGRVWQSISAFFKEKIWQGFCVNILYKKFDRYKGWIYLAPAIVLLLIFTVWPIFNTVRMAFLEGYTTICDVCV